MKQMIKTSLLVISGIVVSWLTFGFAVELKIKNKVKNNLENIGVIYRANKICESTKSVEGELSQTIKQVLAKNPETATLNLNIVTVSSRITISGKAEDKKQIQSAIQTILNVQGVKEVISTVVVDPDIHIANKNTLL